MVVRLRLSRFGCKNRPFFRVMAADSRSPRDGKHLEVLGYFNPLPGDKETTLSFIFPVDLFVVFLHNLCCFFRLCAGQDGGKRMGLKFDRIKYVLLIFLFGF